MKAVLLGLSLVLAACSGSGKSPENQAANAGENAVAPAAAAPAAIEAVQIKRNDDALEFEYGWPKEAAAIAPLNAWLQSHADTQYAEAHKGAEEFRQTAKKEGFPFHPYGSHLIWGTVADTPGALILLGEGYEYTGGAHGMPFTSTLIWDRKAEKRLATRDVMDSTRLASVVRGSFCEKLDKERAERRGAPIVAGTDDPVPEFNRCVDLTKQEIVPMSRSGKALDVVRIVIAPYEAGPYAEGTYEIDLPVTQAMMAAVQPAYRGWFAAGTP